jgi:hypothetical protein
MPVFWVHRERVGERGYNKVNYLILYPLILSFSLRDDCRDAGGRATQDAVAEKGRSVYTVCDWHICPACNNSLY